MKCPLCNIECVISEGKLVVNNGVVSMRHKFMCRNKNCSNFNKVVATVYDPLTVTEDNEAPSEVEES